ncbi:hypothetical protein D3C75_1045820 [compost metagenome]
MKLNAVHWKFSFRSSRFILVVTFQQSLYLAESDRIYEGFVLPLSYHVGMIDLTHVKAVFQYLANCRN